MTLTIFFSSPGTYIIDDDGIRGNNASVVRNSAGAILFPFTHPSDTISFIAEVPGITFIFNTADSFGPADVVVGSLADSGLCPDTIVVRNLRSDGAITLVSNGRITEGGIDSSADIAAAVLVLSAVTGIGTSANALEIQTTFIEAETGTGGINRANFGQVQVGGITADVAGLNVVSSGNLSFSTVGSIFLSDTTAGSTVHGGDLSGNVTLSAIGATSDIYAPINQPAIFAAGGGITLNAGRDILMGVGGSNFNNDILANGDIRINAGRDFQLDGTSNIRTGAFGGVVGGDIFVTAGQNIGLTNTTGGLQTIEAFDGNVSLTTGPGGTYFQNAFFSSAIQTTGDIFLNADNVLLLNGGLNTTGVGQVTIGPVTLGRSIDLGRTTDPADMLALSTAELDRIFSLNLVVGGLNAGSIEVSAPWAPTIVRNLTLHSLSEIFVRSSVTLDGSLTLRAGDDLHFSAAASFVSGSGNFTAFVDDAQDDDGLGGFGTLAGTLSVAGTIRLDGNLDTDTLNGSGANDILMGNGGNDSLSGGGGNDLLNGGLGRDIMTGGTGDDTFVVDHALDQTIEAAGEGIDTVESSIGRTLAPEIERLVLTGTANINGNGNALDNVIFGNSGANQLDGKAGVDTLRGLGGNDTYIVETVGDTVIELDASGTDLVKSSVTFTLGNHIENLTLTGAAPINGTGNSLANTILGNSNANTLNGGGGGDTLKGGSGIDALLGNSGDDDLFGGNGNDDLTGGGGADGFRFDSALNATANVDDILDFAPADDTIFLDRDIFTGIGANGTLAAGAFRAGTVAVDADDRILYDPATGQIRYDADGAGGAAAILFATVAPGTVLTNADFSAYI